MYKEGFSFNSQIPETNGASQPSIARSLNKEDRRGRYKMPLQWSHDLDAALAEAKASNKVLLLDFSAAPA
ncbi:MAG: hypothetical protein DMG72_13510 [Acidobacteria bacterium]|nr:MAG: hypothetical protein DMG72_13510 [Acidobacteriota bacterium]